MNTVRLSVLTLAFAALLSGPAAAADQAGATSRAQVLAELDEAVRTGSLITNESGLSQRELNPSLYPAAAPVAGPTRAQVLAELAEARQKGQLIGGENGLTQAEQFPGQYPVAATAPGKTRAQIKAELEEAIRSGGLFREVG